jgi:hypothetical protein
MARRRGQRAGGINNEPDRRIVGRRVELHCIQCSLVQLHNLPAVIFRLPVAAENIGGFDPFYINAIEARTGPGLPLPNQTVAPGDPLTSGIRGTLLPGRVKGQSVAMY